MFWIYQLFSLCTNGVSNPPPVQSPFRSKSSMLTVSSARELLSKLSILQYSPSVVRLKDRFGDDFIGACIDEVAKNDDGDLVRVDVKKCLRLLYEEAFR